MSINMFIGRSLPGKHSGIKKVLRAPRAGSHLQLAAERYMPYMEHRDGTFMLVEDSKGGRWCCKYR
jgi:hypothetical protein